jgi:hypothetical protein
MASSGAKAVNACLKIKHAKSLKIAQHAHFSPTQLAHLRPVAQGNQFHCQMACLRSLMAKQILPNSNAIVQFARNTSNIVNKVFFQFARIISFIVNIFSHANIC